MNHATREERQNVYADALATFGVDTQLVVALEDLSKLQTELCKTLRGFTHPAQLAEEIAKATIALEQLRYIFSVGPVVDQMLDRKISNLIQRINSTKE